MSRPICWVCGKQLMYVNGKPVSFVYTDPIGNQHKVHKLCAHMEGLKVKPVTAQPSEGVVR